MGWLTGGVGMSVAGTGGRDRWEEEDTHRYIFYTEAQKTFSDEEPDSASGDGFIRRRGTGILDRL